MYRGVTWLAQGKPAEAEADFGRCRAPGRVAEARSRSVFARNERAARAEIAGAHASPSPIAERFAYLYNLAQVISVVIGDQQDFAQIRPPFAVRNLSRQVQIPILNQFDDSSRSVKNAAIEAAHASSVNSPVSFGQ